MTTIGLSYSLVKISTKCAPALTVRGAARAEPVIRRLVRVSVRVRSVLFIR